MRANIFTIIIIMELGLASLIVTETSSQSPVQYKASKKDSTIGFIPLKVQPKIKIDTILSKIDTINKEQIATKKILEKNSRELDKTIYKLKVVTKFIKDSAKAEEFTDTIVIEKVIVKEVPKLDSTYVVIRDTVEVKKTLFQRIFKFLPIKKNK